MSNIMNVRLTPETPNFQHEREIFGEILPRHTNAINEIRNRFQQIPNQQVHIENQIDLQNREVNVQTRNTEEKIKTIVTSEQFRLCLYLIGAAVRTNDNIIIIDELMLENLVYELLTLIQEYNILAHELEPFCLVLKKLGLDKPLIEHIMYDIILNLESKELKDALEFLPEFTLCNKKDCSHIQIENFSNTLKVYGLCDHPLLMRALSCTQIPNYAQYTIKKEVDKVNIFNFAKNLEEIDAYRNSANDEIAAQFQGKIANKIFEFILKYNLFHDQTVVESAIYSLRLPGNRAKALTDELILQIEANIEEEMEEEEDDDENEDGPLIVDFEIDEEYKSFYTDDGTDNEHVSFGSRSDNKPDRTDSQE